MLLIGCLTLRDTQIRCLLCSTRLYCTMQSRTGKSRKPFYCISLHGIIQLTMGETSFTGLHVNLGRYLCVEKNQLGL